MSTGSGASSPFKGGATRRRLGEEEVNGFLTDLAVSAKVAASTQNQALAALLFLYDRVLGRPLDRIERVVRAKRSARLPVVLSREEVARVLERLEGTHALVASVLYGSGLRLLEDSGSASRMSTSTGSRSR
jgi:integrase